MRLPRVTIAGLMAAVAVVAFDFALIRITMLERTLLIGVALNVGFVGWWRGRGARRRFWLGFETAGLAALLAYVGCIEAFPVTTVGNGPGQVIVYLVTSLPDATTRWVASYLEGPGSLSEILDGLLFIVLAFESFYGLPMMILALVGGLLAAKVMPCRGPVPAETDAVGAVQNPLANARDPHPGPLPGGEGGIVVPSPLGEGQGEGRLNLNR